MEELSMATLNVKNLPDPLYKKLQARARRQRRSVAQEVIHLLTQAVKEADAESILELRGLGKEFWKGVDASVHVNTERRSWD
jgi:plasmid stability protein